MKRLIVFKTAIHNRLNANSALILFPAMLLVLLFSGLLVQAQTAPVVAVRFDNPKYDCPPTQTYCVDVVFKSDTPNQKLFGMNLRFYYDDNILEYIGTSDFAQGYSMPVLPEITTGPGSVFGFGSPADWINGQVQLTSTTSVVLPTDGWIKLFRICFHVDDPNSLNLQNFCPSIVWDLQEDPPEIGGGFQPGDDGVVITVVGQTPQQSLPSTENVVQFNWEYGGNPSGFGHPVDEVCISTICGYIIPVSNWALYLAIGLMMIATIFIYRRRISG